MYSEIAEKAAGEIAAVSRVIAANEHVRRMVADEKSPLGEARELFISLYPSPTAWRVIDHCAAVTRLYAIFENCINSLARQWLIELPSLVPDYAALGKKFAKAHRSGVATVLRHISAQKFAHLKDATIGREFSDAANGVPGFVILPECFLVENRTLRMERLRDILTCLTVHGLEQWLEVHRGMRSYVTEKRADETTCAAELKEFIEYRNEAAHGTPREILGETPLQDMAMFVSTLCWATAERFEASRISLLKEHRRLSASGKVVEVYKTPQAVVADVSNIELRIGQTVILSASTLCRTAVVRSLQDNGVAREHIQVRERMEVGICFNGWLPPRGVELYDA